MANSVTTSTRRKRNTPDIMPLGRPASSLALRSASALGKVPLTNDPLPAKPFLVSDEVVLKQKAQTLFVGCGVWYATR